MTPVDTLIHARWIIPVEPPGAVLEDHCLLIRDGCIADLLPSAQARGLQPRVELHLDEHALIPGLINAHTHAAMTLFRGLSDDLPLMEWLTGHIWPAEQAWISSEFVYDGSLLAAAEMLRGGTTCFNDMYFFPDETARAAAAAGMRAAVGLIMIDFPTAWAANPEEYLAKGLELRDRYRNDPLIRTVFAPHAPYTVSDAPLQRIQTLAEELDLSIHMHLHETQAEIDGGLEHHKSRPLERLDRLGALSPRLIAVHMTQLTGPEIARIAQSGAHVVHCPESNLKLASGFCPVHELSRAGVNVALGTDGAASNNDLDMFGEMRTAALLAKAVSGDASAIPACAALQMATLNGARALGIDDLTGSLVPGKAADITAVHLGGLESQPVYHPVSQIVYTAGRHQVSDVWVAGRHVVKERRLATLDEGQILERARGWGAKIAAGG